ncbi:peptide chain release factor N(5)-glutamine methyltransferase [Aquabacterium sp. J223]|uniref:peptide chain release factor N(5)-glutamine methyltransferase n=1 Tax=Aquabacterium sp. J223 TaxID=2898431 RepID=UPI0021AE2682|nr:peptide chain release factor N(5)-glutamine methyltransferase [Aquabacterium sp. J223]UUX95754.1 peptide chain release factor N(5)-glutamine methyltransferase [Aquabacterium sp. J223]
MTAPDEATTVDQALAWARELGVERQDAQRLLGHRLARPRAWLLAHGDAGLTAEQRHGFEADCEALADDQPLAYRLGEQAFHGLTLAVAPGVLVPRPDTEVLVDWALALLQGELADRPSPAVLDLGTGSGAIALAVAAGHPGARVTATDASAAALAIARGNGRRLGVPVDWREGDWWQAVAGDRFDLVLSNPPYIAEGDPHLPALRHEPRGALVAGADGLADIHRIVGGARDHLRPGGWLLLEHGWDQGPAVRERLRSTGLEAVQGRLDLAGRDRCSGGRRG